MCRSTAVDNPAPRSRCRPSVAGPTLAAWRAGSRRGHRRRPGAARIDEIVGSYVTLRNAGGGSMKGLCPFHDEKTPSFQVTPARGLLLLLRLRRGRRRDQLPAEDRQPVLRRGGRAAGRPVGIQLRYTEDGGPRPRAGLRMRLMEAHQAAAEFFAEQLGRPEAIIGRQFLAERGFDRDAAERVRRRLRAAGRAGAAPAPAAAAASATPSWSPAGWSASPAGTSSRAGCCGRSATPAGRCSASAPAGCSTTTGCRRNTSTPRKPRCTRNPTCSTASTWPGSRSARRARPWWSRATPT